MCHGHPHNHPCGHQSVTWHYCPSAVIDLSTGYETPCQNITFAVSQSSSASCPLANCDFRHTYGEGWTCCQCGGRNGGGWCSNMRPRQERNALTGGLDWVERCDHGCCVSCAKDASCGSEETYRKSGRKGKETRVRRPSFRSGSSVSAYNIKLDYRGKEKAVSLS
ncbi:hypothetical protein VTJ83DRAFT_3751 [Remersonia thermophila]|uniref:Uncharacterized protein n=1 Tax=Remersonia thermophila TaxID=72144 RepID=A0ABR4DFH6_9PEZI